jgi:cholesterol oxidase
VSTPEHVDAVVVGSGFGGSVTAYRLQEGGKQVVVLERGKAWPPGTFPRQPREIARNFWDPSKGLHGFFDIWSFKGIESLVSSCLGGGSIIYANVLIRKDEAWFVHEEGENWPVTRADLDPHYDNVERMMKPQRYPFEHEPYASTAKTQAMQAAGERLGVEWQLPNLAVTFGNRGRAPEPGERIDDDANLHGVKLYTCRLVGECNVGCNFGAKNTLDLNYLSRFSEQGGDIRTRCEVRSFAPRAGGGFEVRYVRHLADHEGRETDTSALPLETITCDRLVLSAGSFGSTFLLLKNGDAFPGLSPAVGTRWCGNGDLLGFLAPRGSETRRFDPAIGAVITSALRYEGEHGRGYYIEDGGYPTFVSWLQEMTDAHGELRRAARFVWRRLRDRLTRKPVSNLSAEFWNLLGDSVKSSRSLPLLGMGRDIPDGRLYLDDGYLQNAWSMKSSRAYYDAVKRSMQQIAEATGAKFVDEPLWYFKRVITVHPVGGLPMGGGPEEGVADQYGQVFGHPGLSIADGSVLPGPVGPNPSLTIAAVADRSAEWMLENWRAASAATASRPASPGRTG